MGGVMYKIEAFIDNRWTHCSWSRSENGARKKFDKMRKRRTTCRVVYKGEIIMSSVKWEK